MEVPCDAHQILQSMPCACVVFDDKGKIEFVNSFLCDTLDYGADELLGRNFEVILPIASRLFYQTHFFPLLRLNGKINEIFLMLRSKSGASIPMMINGTREYMGDQIVNLCVCFPVWERQKYENELLESRKVLQKALKDNEELNALKNNLNQHQQRLDQQIATLIQKSQEYVQLNKVLSHDLQEPIRKIGLYNDMLLHAAPLRQDPELYTHAEKIQSTVERLRALTGCLQHFVSVESNEEEITEMDLRQLVEEARAAASQSAGFDDYTLEMTSFPPMQGRASQVSRLFAELIRNAIENRKEDIRLLISIRAAIVEENSYQYNEDRYHYTDHARIEIKDNGRGFENRYSTYVLGLFNKLDPASEGMGMGLALCRQIVSNHYGTMQIQAETGVGCTVIIILPLIQPLAN